MDLRFWVDPETNLPHIFDHGVAEDEVRQVLNRTAEDFPGTDGSRIRLGQTQAGKDMSNKKTKPYPAGWDEARIRKLAEHYDNQTEDEQVSEHRAAFLAEGQTVMVVPSELVPEIVRLISEKRPA